MVVRRLDNERELSTAPTHMLLSTAAEIVRQAEERSHVFDKTVENEIPRFKLEELSIGKVLGRGGFCVVNEINGFRASKGRKLLGRRMVRLSSKLSLKSNDSMDETVMSLGTTNSRGEAVDESSRFVIKRVSEDLIKGDRITYLKGVVDISLETKFLAALTHKHIMNLRGVSEVGPFQEGFFLIVDRLKETLQDRISKWMHAELNLKGISGVFFGSKKKMTSLFMERYTVAYNVAGALDYLHKKKVIYRDLKPSNMGFDVKGTLKLIDFGLAKELRQDELVENGLYKLTGMTGALRYMAPEVGMGKPYNLKADVYSWSMLLWYILQLEPPFGLYSPQMIVERVFKNNIRPIHQDCWSRPLVRLMHKCWDVDISVRPAFHDIVNVVKKEINLVQAELIDES